MEKGSEKYDRLDRLSMAIHVALRNEEDIEGQVGQFLETCWGFVNKDNYENLPRSFHSLNNELKGKLQYGYVEKMSPKTAFWCGALWAMMKVAGMEYEIEKEAEELKNLAKKYAPYKILFLEMQKKPGITLQELVEKTNMSVSKIYDLLMIELRGERLYSYGNAGRHKHDRCCYLGERGEELLRLMEETSK